MKIQEGLITPETAAEYLKSNHDNRRFRKSVAADIRGALLRGEWMLNHQPVAFAHSGRLLDGQHRLTACVWSGKPLRTLVARDCDEKTFLVTDIGTRRTAADILQGDNRIIQACQSLARLDTGRTSTPSEVGKYCDAFGPSVQRLLDASNKNQARVSTARTRGIFAVRVAMGQGDYVVPFYRALVLRDTEELPRVGQSLLFRLIDGIARDAHGVATVWSATDPKNMDNKRTSIKNPDIYIGQMQSEIRQHMARQEAT
jgi:hypothetical protein